MSPERRPLFTIDRNGVHVRRIMQAGDRADDRTPAIAGQRAEDPLLARAGGTVAVSFSGTAWDATTAGTRAGVSRHAPERGKRPQHLSQDQRVDASAVRTAGRGRDGGTLGPGDARLGEPILLGSGRCGLRGDRRACDEAATPVAVPEAQGADGEVRAWQLPRVSAWLHLDRVAMLVRDSTDMRKLNDLIHGCLQLHWI